MAGLGRKVFNAGEVLSAANVQGYLQDQVVQVYSGTAARSSALGTAVSEGMMSYLTDSNELSVYTANGTAAWSPVNLAQSPNVLINGSFDFWQRGTSSASGGYLADRWTVNHNTNPTTYSQSQQTFTPGTAPVAGYEGQFFFRYAVTTVGTGASMFLNNKVEDVRTFAGQEVTISFWAKADSARTITANLQQNFGSGGSSAVDYTGSSLSVTTSWQRFTQTFTVASIAGKTVGTSSFLNTYIRATTLASGMTLDIWGVQLEAGSVATPFRRSSPTLQGELAACQRYYYRFTSNGDFNPISFGNDAASATAGQAGIKLPVTMRTKPASMDYSGTWYYSPYAGVFTTLTGLTWSANSSADHAIITVTAASGLSTSTKYQLFSSNSTATFIGFSAEL